MSRGVVSGIVVGFAVSALGLSALSLMAPLPQRETVSPPAGEVPAEPATGRAEEPAAEQPAAEAPAEPAEEPEAEPAAEAPDETAAEAAAEPVAETPEAPAADAAKGSTADAPEEAPPALEPAPAPDAAPQAPLEAPAPAPGTPPVTGGVELPPGSEFNRPKPEGEARLPGTDAQPAPGPAPAVSAPDAAEITSAPRPDTTPAETPEAVADTPAAIAPPPAEEEAPALATGEEQPVLPSPAAIEPEAPEAETVPEVPPAPTPAPEPEPEMQPQPEPETQPAPEPVEPVEGGERGEAAPDPGTGPEVASGGPVPAGMIGEAPEAIRVPAPGAEIAKPDVVTGRLPSIGAKQEAAPAADLGALARHAVPFTPEPGKPLFSVILVDTGEAGLDRAALTTFSFPVTFAIDATRPDAAEAMAQYRAAGFEVILLPGPIEAGATEEELDAKMSEAFGTVPEAVAVLEGRRGGLHANRGLLGAFTGLLGDSGHGFVAFDKALNTAAHLAQSDGIPTATIFRRLDAERESAPVIKRYLDRAVFKAEQDGQVVMLGHSYPDTVTALFSWAIEGKGTEVNLAPISAVLRAE
ncbi:MAG: divergent polysaccharide deacetylase family protein [Paracoccaceae bacterium]